MKIQNIIIVLVIFLTIGTPSQAATISGSSERDFKGECDDLFKITYTSDNPGTLLTTAVIDVSTASSGTVFFKRLGSDCGTPGSSQVGRTGSSISPDGKQIIINFNNFNPGETYYISAATRQDPNENVVLGNDFGGSTFSATFTDSGCTLAGTYIKTGSSDNSANFVGTCGSGDLNGNEIPADAGDLVLMKRASIGEILADSRYDLNKNGQFADAGDLVLMKRASIGEITL